MKNALTPNMAVLTKELRTRMRGRRVVIITTLYLLLLATAGAMVLEVQRSSLHSHYNPSTAAATAAMIFSVLSVLQLTLIVFIVPGMTASAIAGERDRQTLDLLLSTQVSSVGIVLGKLLSSISYVLLLLVASLPVFSLVFLFGGISPRQISLLFLISTATAVTLGSIGIALSSWLRRGQAATVATYAVAFGLVIGTLALSAFISITAATQPTVAAVPTPTPDSPGPFSPWQWALVPLIFNPFIGLLGVLPNWGFSFGGGGRLSLLAMWQANLIADAVIIVLCTLLSVRAMRPRRGLFRPRNTRKGTGSQPSQQEAQTAQP